ncbi:MAG: hypothetical protein V1911_02965 [Candidatus Micrarchaeota archaeon]
MKSAGIKKKYWKNKSIKACIFSQRADSNGRARDSRNRGFLRMLEVSLAIVLIYGFMNTFQLEKSPAIIGSENEPRLQRYAQDTALAVCNNKILRGYFAANATGIPNINASLPADIEMRIYVYTNATDDKILDDLVNETGNTLGGKTVVTASCVTAGYSEEDYPIACYNGTGCFSEMRASDDTDVSIAAGGSVIIKFDGPVIADSVKLKLEGMHGAANGLTSVQYWDGDSTENADSYAFSSSADENKTFDLTAYLPDGNSVYNVTITSNVSATFDFAEMKIVKYAPKKIVVAVWNKELN